ncbi:MAG: ABC transporter permease [Planctomycetaceae bacterium]|nr:ABC transporter permease [Planctomycetaceae bacterium]
MFRGTFALLQQALRTDSRKLSTHLFMLLFVAGILIMLYATEQGSSRRSAPGKEFFTSICYLNYGAIILAGLGFFSSAITEEKEDGTLGLLKMTGMSPLVLLLGKSTSRLIYALILLSVQVPFVLLSITLGGVMLNQIIAAYVGLAAFLIMVANFGLLASVIGRNSRQAIALMVILAVVYIVLLVIMIVIVESTRRSMPGTLFRDQVEDVLEFFALNHVIYRISEVIMQTGFNESPFSWQVWGNLAQGGFYFLFSWVLFEPCTASSLQTDSGPERADLFKTRKTDGKNRNRGRAWDLALAWKDFHFIAGGFSSFLFKYILYSLIIGLICFLIYLGENFHWGMQREDLSWLLISFSLVILAIELCVYAARIFQDEVRWQTLSVLVMLPLSIPQIAYQKIAGCLWGLVPITTFLLLGCALAPENVFEFLENVFFNEYGFFIILMILGFCVAFLHLIAYLSLYVKWGAIPVAIGVTVFFLTCCGIGTGAIFDGGGGGDGGFYVFSFVWIGIFGVITVVLHILTGEKLRDLAAKK